MSPFHPFILLHDSDNILVCRGHTEAGATIEIDGRSVTLTSVIQVGHKIARHDLALSDKIIKYGAPIGSMTEDAAQGDHVHLHNMQSDYIKVHTREATGHG